MDWPDFERYFTSLLNSSKGAIGLLRVLKGLPRDGVSWSWKIGQVC